MIERGWHSPDQQRLRRDQSAIRGYYERGAGSRTSNPRGNQASALAENRARHEANNLAPVTRMQRYGTTDVNAIARNAGWNAFMGSFRR
jgi:hypothetical protein